MTDLHSDAPAGSRSAQLDRAIRDLLSQAPELEAAAVVSFDGLPMAAALPSSMDEDRVAAMSAALLSLGERAAQGLGRGELSQVYIEGDEGTVFLVSADDEAVLVAVASKGAKAGMMMYEVRRTAAVVAAALRAEPGDAVEDVVLAPEPAVRIPVQAAVAPVQAPAEPRTHDVPAGYPAAPAAPAYDVPRHEVPVAQAPAYGPPSSPTPAYEVPSYEPAVSQVPTYAAPVYEAPVHEAPIYEAPTYEPPTYEAPLYELPVYLAQQSFPPAAAEPAPVHPTAAAEPVWPLYAPTGSVMPGGGVPPSTWS